MEQFIEKYREQIAGVLSGWDRLILRASLRRLNYGNWDRGLGAVVARGMEQYLWQNGILFKDYSAHVKRISEQVKQASLKAYREQDLPVIFVRDPRANKEEMARKVAAERGIEQGLVCAISSLEPSPTFEHRGTHMVRRTRPCHVLYHYQIHPQWGWMHARLQTWFPFHVQVGLNGREWLARRMRQEGIQHRQQGNCFVWMEDYERAQALLREQLNTPWAERLNEVVEGLHPLREAVLARYPCDYYWTCYQSEWATDLVFENPDVLKRLMPLLVRHGVLSFSSVDVMRYFGKRLTQSGEIPASFHKSLQTDVRRYPEGERVKYRLNGNSAKFYDKAYSVWGAVLRGAETTLNAVEDFRVYRPKEGGAEDDLAWRPLRRGIADLHRRAELSQAANARLLNALASVDDSRRVTELVAQVQQPTHWRGRRVRAMRPWAQDLSLLTAVNSGDFFVHGLRNRDLQHKLYAQPPATPQERRRRSARVSRLLRLLRAHGILQKVNRTHRYHVTPAGRTLIGAVLATAQTSLQQLNALHQAA